MTGLTIVGCIFNRVVRMRSQIFVILGGKKILVSRDLQARHVKTSVPPKITLTITPLYSVRLKIFEWLNCFFEDI